ncbi:MAG: VWA domain-containing protein [Ilumatobacteraceae bacterium]|nr:VWA domain-containing protein [Ilumatobacteraceae bacterium]
MITSRTALSAVSVAVLIAGCGSNLTPVAAPDTSTPSSTTGPTTTPAKPVERGWIGGEPSWVAEYSDASGDAKAMSSAGAAAGTVAAAAVTDEGIPPGVGPSPGLPQPVEQAGLRAGSVDDNVDFADFLTYLARIHDLGITTRAFDPTGRVVVTVVGTSGLPVPGAQVSVSSIGTVVASLRTTADGTARFLPALYGAGAIPEFTFTSGDVSVNAAPGSSVTLQPAAAGGRSGPVALDVLFLLDATGSMGDEIGRLKTTIDTVAAQVAGFESKPDVRFAMTLYRDEGDTFVTSTFDFTGDIEVFRAALNDVVADGGGDYPEAVEEGLESALSEPSWRDPASTLQLVFLVGDAPPRLDRQVPVEYPAAVIDAVARGIKVFPIASSESDDQAEAVFREIAAATGARFVFLSYGAQGAATGDATDISSTDYEELPLDALVVRLIAEEVAALSGTPVQLTPITVPQVTNPNGQ